MALDLGKQVGPLPLGAWIAVVGGGLGIAYFMNRGGGDEEAVALAERGVGTGGGQFVQEPPQFEEPEPGDEVPENNDSWGRKVTNWLIAQNHDPGLSDNAVRKYLSGMSLSLREQALIDRALVRFGAPPEPIQPVDKVPDKPSPEPEDPNRVWGKDVPDALKNAVSLTHIKRAFSRLNLSYARYINMIDLATALTRAKIPWGTKIDVNDMKELEYYGRTGKLPASARPGGGKKKKPPKKKTRRYTVRRGDTLSHIAQRYYGNGTKPYWRRIYNRNRSTIESTARAHGKRSSRGGPRNEVAWWIFPGTTLVIP